MRKALGKFWCGAFVLDVLLGLGVKKDMKHWLKSGFGIFGIFGQNYISAVFRDFRVEQTIHFLKTFGVKTIVCVWKNIGIKFEKNTQVIAEM